MEEQRQYNETPQPSRSTAKAGNSFAIPLSIIVGFGLIAGAIYFSNNSVAPAPQQATNQGQNAEQDPPAPTTGPIRPVDETDHIRGNPNAPIVIVEYSDYDCPFCKNFHSTMQQVMESYGTEGTVAWVYRHFPLEQLHPSAPFIAQASECVAELGGNDAFWTFSDLVFNERGTNEPTNIARLPEFAETSGVSIAAYESCMESERTKELVEEDFNDALKAGARGTPHSLILFAGQQGVINGAQPYNVVNGYIESLLEQMNTAEASNES